MKHKTALKLVVLPLIFLALSLIYMVMWRLLNLPRGDEFVALVTDFFAKYGLWMVLLCSIVESGLLIGNYFPGGVVIFLSVIAAGHSPWQVVATVAVVSLGFFIGYGVDYVLGKYGWYEVFMKFGMEHQLERAQKNLTRHSFKAFLGSYWEPNLASISATAAGVLQLSSRKFLIESTLAIIVWNIFWGLLVVVLGDQILVIFSRWEYLIYAVIVWGLVVLAKELLARRKLQGAVENSKP